MTHNEAIGQAHRLERLRPWWGIQPLTRSADPTSYSIVIHTTAGTRIECWTTADVTAVLYPATDRGNDAQTP